MVGFGVTRVLIFLKLQMWKLVKSKIAMILVQNWVCKNEVIHFKTTKISKNHHMNRISFQIHSNKFYSKNDNLLLVIEFRRYSEFFFSEFIK